MIVEPDAIGMSCLDPPQQQRRLALLRYAINRLTSNPQALVYLHAGSSRVAGDPTPLLVQAGVARARGIAVNVSGYGTTDDETAYADAIIAKLADQDITAHAVIDTSRNGIGRAEAGAESASSFCNQAGRSLGPRPTTRTGDPHVDAWLWVKPPGESDGACHGARPAGSWDNDYALGLARSALARGIISELSTPR